MIRPQQQKEQRRRLVMRTLLILMFGFASATAHAGAQTTFGSTTAQSCYQVATFGTSFADMRACDDAIKTGELTRLDLAATYSNRGIIQASSGQLELAIADHTAAIRLNPQSVRAYVNRANSLFRLQRYAEALADYDRAIELSAGAFALAFYNRSFVHRALDQRDAARKDLEQAATLAPEVAAYQQALKGAN
jgi:tetratricopeptide (TPR) repeat protein